MRLAAFVLLACLAGAVSAVASPDAAALNARKTLLTEELALAKEDKVYFVVDLAGSAIRFRAKGLTLVELPVAGVSTWGRGMAEPRMQLQAKEALFAPKREVIQVKPPQVELKAPAEPPALELRDMPTRYRLVFTNGLQLAVYPQPGGLLSATAEKLRKAGWLLSRPVLSNWNFLFGTPYTEIRLALQPDDARLLYWSLTEGADALIIWPQG